MAENVDATLEENKQLREQIEAVQRERRRNFAEADQVHEEVLARQENERLKEVLASQEKLLEDATKAKELAAEPRKAAVQVPYTITKDGPVYSTPNTEQPKGEEPVAQSSGSRPAAGTASRPPHVPLSTPTGDDDENKEN